MSSKFLDKTGLNTLWAKIKSTFQTLGNLVTTSTGWSSTPSDTKYPSEKLVKNALDGKLPLYKLGSEVPSSQDFVCLRIKANYVRGVDKSQVLLYDITSFADGTINENDDAYVGFKGFFIGGKPQGEGEVICVKICAKVAYGQITGSSGWRTLKSDSITCGPEIIKRTEDGVDKYYLSIFYDCTLYSGNDVLVGQFRWRAPNGISVYSYQNGVIGEYTPNQTYPANEPLWDRLQTFTSNIHANTSTKLATARKLKTNLARTADSTFDGSADQTNIPVTGTLPVANGGTGKTTAKAAQNALLGGMNSVSTDAPSDASLVFKYASPTDADGALFTRPLSKIWTWIKNQISSVLGLTVTSYGGNAATATMATTAAGYTSGGAIDTALQGKVDKETGKGLSTNDFTDTYKSSVDSNTSARHTHSNKSVLDGISSTDVANWNAAEPNVQSDWNQATSTADDYIKNKPTLGTAAAKDVPASGNASTTQVVMGSDSRLSDARPASDVPAWAKEATKPAYTASEVGAVPTSRTVNGKALSSNITLDASDVGSLDGHRVWSGGANSVYGYKVCETANIAHGSSNVYAIAMGTMALTNKYATDPQASTTSARDGSLAFGSFYIWCYGTPEGTLTCKARLFSSNPAFNNTDLALCYRKDGDKIEWFVGFGPLDDPVTASSALTVSRPFGMSVSFDYTQNIVVPDSLDPVPSGKHYDDWYGLFKQPYMLNRANGVGSLSQPVFVKPNGQIEACKKLVQAVTSIDTSTMDADVLYVM